MSVAICLGITNCCGFIHRTMVFGANEWGKADKLAVLREEFDNTIGRQIEKMMELGICPNCCESTLIEVSDDNPLDICYN